ncbi:MAG TPA: uridine kinase [Kofleriaceae bacterium]|nr:uridine kinase [Kofleriaceae bacterium]
MRPALFIGVAGGTGSGKTTVARKLAEALPEGSATVIEYDSYYRDRSDLSPEERAALNYDHPDALESELLAEHLRILRTGKPVEVPIYDFRSHTRSPRTRQVVPTAVVLVEGILTFVAPAVREQLDIKIFVDTDADIRVFRRIRRDLEERGRSFASVREQYYRSVRPMHQQFVEPSKRWADLIIPEGGDNHVALEILVARLLQATERWQAHE